jgi:hypothetical protein
MMQPKTVNKRGHIVEGFTSVRACETEAARRALVRATGQVVNAIRGGSPDLAVAEAEFRFARSELQRLRPELRRPAPRARATQRRRVVVSPRRPSAAAVMSHSPGRSAGSVERQIADIERQLSATEALLIPMGFKPSKPGR